MKKLLTILTIVTLVFLFTMPNPVFGQMGITKGVKAGLNMATITGDDVDMGTISPGTRMGFSVGGFVILDLPGMLGVRPEVLYSMKGAIYDTPAGDAIIKLDYVEVPVLLQYDLMLPGPVSPVFFAGPALAFNLSAKAESPDGTEEDIDDIKSMDIGAVVGAGVILNGKITVDLRITLGLSTIDDSDDEADVKNQVISLMAGICL
jgi:hypothetical protein